MVAYLMQSLIIFYIWLAMRGLQVLPNCIRCLYRRNRKHETIHSPSMEEKLNNHVLIVKSVLVDFQEAQCFFVVCIQAAILVAFAGDSAILNASSVAQLQHNYAEAITISGSGAISVTFGLWVLHRSNLDSFYIHLWTAASIAVSATAIFSRSAETPKLSSISWQGDLSHLDRCGHHYPPLIYCSYSSTPSGQGAYIRNFIARQTYAAPFAIFWVLGMQKIITFLPGEHGLLAPFFQLSRSIQSIMPPRAISILTTVWELLAESYLLGMTIFVLVMYWANLIEQANHEHSYATTWNFGQIIGSTIWAPSIVRYIYWSVCTWTIFVSRMSRYSLTDSLFSRHRVVFCD